MARGNIDCPDNGKYSGGNGDINGSGDKDNNGGGDNDGKEDGNYNSDDGGGTHTTIN